MYPTTVLNAMEMKKYLKILDGFFLPYVVCFPLDLTFFVNWYEQKRSVL